ncbi:MAG: DUF6350 family protein [Propionibacteriaceae bacterium]|nr:DUF6350 family protein [Propionibacteriaceae bacterium]
MADFKQRRWRFSPGTDAPPTPADSDPLPLFPWPFAALASGIAAAVGAWLVLAGVSLVAWSQALTMPLPQVFGFATSSWLLSNGLPLAGDGYLIAIAPLGVSGLSVVLCRWCGQYAARQAQLARPGMNRMDAAWRVAGLTVLGYLVVVALLTITSGRLEDIAAGLVGGALIAGVGSCWGCAVVFQLFAHAPAWLLRLGRGAKVGLAVLALTAVAALSVAVIGNADRIEALEAGLKLDQLDAVTWGFAVLAYLPNALLWVLSWMLGAGFTLGNGSLVTLSGVQLGMLPDLPIFGALPATGVAPPAMLYWMGAGVIAGLAAGALAGLPRPLPRLWLGAAVSVGSGLLVAGTVWVLAWASRGDLGTLRMSGMGPRLADLALVAPALIALSAAMAGLAFGLRASEAEVAVPQADLPASDTADLRPGVAEAEAAAVEQPGPDGVAPQN